MHDQLAPLRYLAHYATQGTPPRSPRLIEIAASGRPPLVGLGGYAGEDSAVVEFATTGDCRPARTRP